MKTEYEVSTTLYYWGNKLNPDELANELNLKAKCCLLRHKGDELKSKVSGAKSIVKTGLLKYRYLIEFPEDNHNPEKQFEFFTNKLKKKAPSLYNKYCVEKARLGISAYYEKDNISGEPDFIIPTDLLAELHRHNIEIMVTVMP